MTINFDDDLPGVLRSGPEPIIPDDSESEGTLRHVVEDLRRKSHGLGIHPPDMVTETVDGAGERVEGSVGARGGVVLGDGVGPARMDDVPL